LAHYKPGGHSRQTQERRSDNLPGGYHRPHTRMLDAVLAFQLFQDRLNYYITRLRKGIWQSVA